MRELALIVCLTMLTGCETLSEIITKTSVEPGSFAAPELTDAESQRIARDMVKFLANQFPYAKTTINLGQVKTEFQTRLVATMAQQGFGVVERRVPGSVDVHYAVTLLDSGIAVRMRFAGKEASRFYARTDKGLGLRGAYALREAVK